MLDRVLALGGAAVEVAFQIIESVCHFDRSKVRTQWRNLWTQQNDKISRMRFASLEVTHALDITAI